MIHKIKQVIKKENITFKKICNPFFVLKLLNQYGYITFFAVGGTGLLLNLSIVYLLTTYLFGLENYYQAYLFGLAANLIYNFALHTIITFKTKKRHKTRFFLFVVYSIILTFLQAITVKFVTPIVGLEYYLFVIAVFVLCFSTITFVIFKLFLFRENEISKKRVLVSGCYDLLHPGHIEFFRQASKYGDLFVCVGKDSTIMDLKKHKTLLTEDERAYMINAIKYVKEARVSKGSGMLDFKEDLLEIKPDYFVVNDEGATKEKEALCKKFGIKYITLMRTPPENLPARSSTALKKEAK